MEGTQHIAGKGMNSLSHYNLVHMFIPMPQASIILDATAALEKMEKLEKIPALMAADESQKQKLR